MENPPLKPGVAVATCWLSKVITTLPELNQLPVTVTRIPTGPLLDDSEADGGGVGVIVGVGVGVCVVFGSP